MKTVHYSTERMAREAFIKSIGEGKIVLEKIVDKGHPNGAERHSITDNGIIIVHNVRTGKLVTKLIARPAQLKRYFANGIVPTEIYKRAKAHQEHGYNLM